ncbi:MAG: SDR family NAD(P)-dependent oxidoreductase [Burkholderiaceae bacterium]|jgi:17beta-estradiol 17-dehydrogenase / very-long-chain 3-oxoacyl-CoA reductase|nr:SDR family NAD(P)-dependent oxidoreductase [Burkholderiaceae bacterium]
MILAALFLFQVLGAILLVIAAVNVARWLWQYTWLPRQLQGSRLAERYGPGSWALITGASDGLGKAFAQKLARYGFNLLLVSRTQEKLNRLQTELETFGIHARTVCADLSNSSEPTYSLITAAAQDVDLSIVINCVGVTVHQLYADIPSSTVRHLLSLNVNTTAIVTHTTLPLLLRHTATTGRRGALLNVGSIVGRFYWPGTQLYGACKAFIDHLTVPLAFEYRAQLDVLSFQPTVMATAMATGTEPAAITITPQAAAHAALSHLGRCVTSHGHWRHAMLAALFSILPSKLRNRIFLKNALEMGDAERAKGN